MNHGNSVLQRVLRSGERDLMAVEDNLALVLLIGSEEALHHRGLSGTVLSHETHDGAPPQIEVDVIQHAVSAEGL